ncbi:7-carboxy-7-deazaguanine synthase QueE [Leptospira idonii]|uniref:7-carboxy-7-deazaguanine synthase n=1 Tax=Leptospira idonii TaxID=1193500 RepID=A0A4R9M309_9LEPT|nr:7-carboxy-7-deazaguanine synthase QueE [Leptospira idonii]TGN20285.1 4Fe-4S cluster-binding domain-containing protein [Leptospira idonii]
MLGNIHEIYYSVSGEGISQGIPTVFVRFAGCSLRCGKTEDRKLWCDTAYALGPNQGKSISISEIFKEIQALDPKSSAQILLTGGEPLEGKNGEHTDTICRTLFHERSESNHPYPAPRIETNGKETLSLDADRVFTMDYKLPGSGMEEKMNLENFEILKKRHNSLDEIKFVVRDRYDFQRSLEILHEKKPNTNILYSPVHDELDAKELVDWIKIENPPKARLSLQIHKVLWGNKKGV